MPKAVTGESFMLYLPAVALRGHPVLREADRLRMLDPPDLVRATEPLCARLRAATAAALATLWP